MTYKVVLQPLAQQDALDFAWYIKVEKHEPESANRWLTGLQEQIETLSEHPRRFPIVAEQEHFPIEIRQFVDHSHRVVFHISDPTSTVHVIRVYHGSRDALKPGGVPVEPDQDE